MGVALKKLGISLKKILNHSKANEDAHIRFQKSVSTYEKKGNILFIYDESGFSKDRLHVLMDSLKEQHAVVEYTIGLRKVGWMQ